MKTKSISSMYTNSKSKYLDDVSLITSSTELSQWWIVLPSIFLAIKRILLKN